MTALAVAHRGDPYVQRENTLASLRSAVAAGADAVEFDVRTTRDGVPVLLHDATLKRLWKQDVRVDALDRDEVQARTGGGVPTLREALKALGEGPGARSLIDLPDAATAEAAVAEVRDGGAAGRAYYCGDTAALLRVRDLDPSAEISLTRTSLVPLRPELVARLRPRWLNYRFGLLTPALVRQAHEAGHLVSAWTVDRKRTMRRLHGMGVDSVTSNRIDCLRTLLGPRGS